MYPGIGVTEWRRADVFPVHDERVSTGRIELGEKVGKEGGSGEQDPSFFWTHNNSSSIEVCLYSAGLLLGRGIVEALGGLSHYLEAFRRTAEQCHVTRIPWVIELLGNLQESLSALSKTISQAWLLCLESIRRRRCISLHCLYHRHIIGLGLTLPASGGSIRRGWGSILGRGSRVIVHSLHVVPEIPMAWKAIAGNGAFTSFICAEVGLVAMSMHGVGFTLMTEEAGRGRETGVLTSMDLAPVWLQMGVHEFADRRRG